jgi:hypothetical protein
MDADRRRSPRVEMLGRVRGHSSPPGSPIYVREMSLGGMAVETPFELTVGMTHEFRLRLGDDSTVDVRGRVLRCQNIAADDAPALYLSGIQFEDDEEPIADVMDRIKPPSA